MFSDLMQFSHVHVSAILIAKIEYSFFSFCCCVISLIAYLKKLLKLDNFLAAIHFDKDPSIEKR